MDDVITSYSIHYTKLYENYRQDKKNGYTITRDFYYTEDSSKVYYQYSKELFVNGSREGLSFYYDTSGYKRFSYLYKFDKRSGEGREFDKDA